MNMSLTNRRRAKPAFCAANMWHPMQHWQGEPRMIRLQTLRDPFDEAMEVAAQARELARNGMRWRDIAVVSPRMDEYRHLLERAFALYDVHLS